MTSGSARSVTRTETRRPSRLSTVPRRARSSSARASVSVNETRLSGSVALISARRSPSWISLPASITMIRGHSATTSSM
jgi:hypothetical protein